jgi:hypothetical protein
MRLLRLVPPAIIVIAHGPARHGPPEVCIGDVVVEALGEETRDRAVVADRVRVVR